MKVITILIVSHDRDLLNTACEFILHLERGKLKLYTGGYDTFVENVRLRMANADLAYKAEAASRAKSRFLANMSHELRTPLNAIIGFAEVIHNQFKGPVGNPQYIDFARSIHESGRHLVGIINDILDLSKVEEGKLELEEQAATTAPQTSKARCTGKNFFMSKPPPFTSRASGALNLDAARCPVGTVHLRQNPMQ